MVHTCGLFDTQQSHLKFLHSFNLITFDNPQCLVPLLHQPMWNHIQKKPFSYISTKMTVCVRGWEWACQYIIRTKAHNMCKVMRSLYENDEHVIPLGSVSLTPSIRHLSVSDLHTALCDRFTQGYNWQFMAENKA